MLIQALIKNALIFYYLIIQNKMQKGPLSISNTNAGFCKFQTRIWASLLKSWIKQSVLYSIKTILAYAYVF